MFTGYQKQGFYYSISFCGEFSSAQLWEYIKFNISQSVRIFQVIETKDNLVTVEIF